MPESLPLFEGFGESSFNSRLLFWVPIEMGIQTKSDVSITIFNKFKEHDIEIPFPLLDLHVKKILLTHKTLLETTDMKSSNTTILLVITLSVNHIRQCFPGIYNYHDDSRPE